MPKLIDLHQDLVSHLRSGMTPQTDLNVIYQNTAAFFGSVFFEPSNQDPSVELQKIKQDIAWYRTLAQNPLTPFFVIRDKNDLEKVDRENKRGVLIHLEGANILIPEREDLLEEWYTLGLRSLGLLWNQDNALGVAAASFRGKEGLTDFGKRIVRRCDDLGILVDCSHLNEAGFYDVLEIAKRSPLVTHGNAYAICPNPRNFTDQQIRDLAERGGVIGVFFSGKYVHQNKPPTLDDVATHIERIAEYGGIECVAIGSDFGGITTGVIPGLSHIRDLPNLEAKLRERGFTPTDIQKIFYDNALRYLTSTL